MENDEFPVQDDEKCAICIEDLENKDYLKVQTFHEGKTYGCGHKFHKDCVKKWLQTASICPLCRHELPVEEDTEEMDQIEQRFGAVLDINVSANRLEMRSLFFFFCQM